MSGIFIDNNETISFNVFVGLDSANKLYAAESREELVKESSLVQDSIMSYSFEFRVPTYRDNMDFFSRSVKTDAQGEFEINPSLLRYERFVSLLCKWDLKDSSGNVIKPIKENIDKLNPVLADVVMAKLEDTIS